MSDSQIVGMLLSFCKQIRCLYPEHADLVDEHALTYIQLCIQTGTQSLVVSKLRQELAPFRARILRCDESLLDELPPIAGLSFRDIWHSERTTENTQIYIFTFLKKLATLLT